MRSANNGNQTKSSTVMSAFLVYFRSRGPTRPSQFHTYQMRRLSDILQDLRVVLHDPHGFGDSLCRETYPAVAIDSEHVMRQHSEAFWLCDCFGGGQPSSAQFIYLAFKVGRKSLNKS
jgi:hypothetical protein